MSLSDKLLLRKRVIIKSVNDEFKNIALLCSEFTNSRYKYMRKNVPSVRLFKVINCINQILHNEFPFFIKAVLFTILHNEFPFFIKAVLFTILF